jgi:FKBP-type peptidyl-prolyl cis-trans isomerase FkpA
MRNKFAVVYLLLIAFLSAPSSGLAQPPADSATLQIRHTTFAPWLHVNLFYSYQTWSGTFVRDLLPGNGLPMGLSSNVRITLRMWLADGTPIINPAQPGDTVWLVIGRGSFIRGVEEGITGMRLGGVRQLVIPSIAGFGPAGRNSVPPNAVLIAEVALVGAALGPERVAR